MFRHRRADHPTIARVEILEGRQLMANAFLHIGPLTPAVEAAPKTAANGWAEVSSFSWGSTTQGTINAFHVITTDNAEAATIAKDVASGAKFKQVELVEFKAGKDGTPEVTDELDFSGVTFTAEQWMASTDGSDIPEVSIAASFTTVSETVGTGLAKGKSGSVTFPTT